MTHKKGEYRICLNCGKQFWIFESRLQLNKKYCSQLCKVKHSQKKATCICKNCGKEYQEWKYRIEKQGAGKYCSKACAKINLLGKPLSKEHIAKCISSRNGYYHSEDTKLKISKSNKGKKHSEETKAKMKGRIISEDQRKKASDQIKKYYIDHPEKKLFGNKNPMFGRTGDKNYMHIHRLSEEERLKRYKISKLKFNEKRKLKRKELAKSKIPREIINHKIRLTKLGEKNPNYGKKLSEHTIEKRTISCKETEVGGFWYGNIIYYERIEKVYCELWTPELCERIRAAWNYKSAISGKTKEDNKGKALSCHHVYYQTKACCEWDEDVGGYYAWINLGRKKKPDMYKHYIKGDPNKFVPLTRGEHSATNSNKLFWILYFEDIISRKLGKCYLSKEEMTTFF